MVNLNFTSVQPPESLQLHDYVHKTGILVWIDSRESFFYSFAYIGKQCIVDTLKKRNNMEPETDAITHLREISTSLETVKRQCTSFLQRPKNHKGPNGAVKAVRTVVDASDRNLRALEDVVAQGTSVAAEKQPTAESVAKNDIPGATTTPAISMSKPEPDAVQGHASSAIPNGFMTDSLFSSLPVSEPTKRALRDTFGYSRMTEVQKASLPVGLKGGQLNFNFALSCVHMK